MSVHTSAITAELGNRTFRDAIRWVRWHIGVAALLTGFGFFVGFLTHTPVATSAQSSGWGVLGFADPTVVTLAFNNLLVAGALVAGGVSLGAVTVSGLVYNGFLLGTVVKALSAQGVAPYRIALSIAPHGLLELPGLLIAGGVGLRYGMNVWLYIIERRDTPLTAEETAHGIRLCTIVIACIATAAVIELHGTPRLL